MASKNRKFHTMQPHNQYFKFLDYLRSLPDAQANYENVPRSRGNTFVPKHHNHNYHQNTHTTQQHHHQTPFAGHSLHYHSRSQSNHNAATMSPNNYYNLPHIEAAFPRATICERNVARSRRPPRSMLAGLSPMCQQHKRAQLDSMTVMRLGAELGFTIDAAPEMPPSRKYSICEAQNGQMYKILFPQTRSMAIELNDPLDNVYIAKAESVTVLGPSSEDRSKFTVCYKVGHIDLPHQYTQQPSVRVNSGAGCYPFIQWQGGH